MRKTKLEVYVGDNEGVIGVPMKDGSIGVYMSIDELSITEHPSGRKRYLTEFPDVARVVMDFQADIIKDKEKANDRRRQRSPLA